MIAAEPRHAVGIIFLSSFSSILRLGGTTLTALIIVFLTVLNVAGQTDPWTLEQVRRNKAPTLHVMGSQ